MEEEVDVGAFVSHVASMIGEKAAVQGIQLKKEISPQTPLIMLTGFGELMKAKGELPKGVDYLLSKPLTFETYRQAFAAYGIRVSLEGLREATVEPLEEAYDMGPGVRLGCQARILGDVGLRTVKIPKAVI